VALTAVDRLLAGYLVFVTIVIGARGLLADAQAAWLVLMHALFGVMLWLFTRLRPEDRFGQALRVLYPVLMLVPFYREFGVINSSLGPERILAHDAVVQGWEAALFGGQPSYEWIRQAPSVFWSGLLHLAYFGFYPIVVLGPLLLVTGREPQAGRIMFTMMLAFVACYVVFLTWPVAGPYYAFPQPAGPVRDVFSARWVYAVLSEGSSIGAAFPSSHVASTVALTGALCLRRNRLGAWLLVPTLLLTVGTVYCQMHYAVDALTGVVVGLAAVVAGRLVGGGRVTSREEGRVLK
jgi:membrane-associated phospholipid phosphatase